MRATDGKDGSGNEKKAESDKNHLLHDELQFVMRADLFR
jgi:hypothetical protein